MSRARFYIIGFIVLALFDTWTQIAFKLAANQTGAASLSLHWLASAALNPWIYGSIAGYLGAFFTWMTLLKHAPVGPAVAASHLDVVAVLIASRLLFNEQLSAQQIFGALCIVLGIVILGSSAARRAGTEGL